jgi:acetylornithine deacetylase/succinyl-diaminopimelate desuccinylase-like protein
MSENNGLSQVLAYAKENRENFKQDLISLAKIPSVSARGYDPEQVVKSAEEVARVMEESGLNNVEVIKFSDSHPYAYGEWLELPGKPTLLLYAHHDVQPPGKAERWKTPGPFEPTEIDGRLYGRGVVDDKAGVMIHLAAIKSYLKSEGTLPVNIKIIVEGEEEIGSDHLGEFVAIYKDKLQADCMVLTDTANLYEGLPSITYLLRGMVGVDVEVKALSQQVHSGMWGGPVPDPAMALCQLLATLKDPNGMLTIEGVYNGVKKLSESEKQRLRELPYDENLFKEHAGLLPGAALHKMPDTTVYEQLWHLPSLTVTALESCTIKDSANQIIDSARARVGIRVVPEQNPDEISDLLVKHLKKNAPEGVVVEIEPHTAALWWYTEPKGPAFDAACQALEKGFGKKPVFIGAGGTIPFVKPFADNLGGVPALLLGLEDPICHAHSENESLSLADFYKAIDSAIHLYTLLPDALR